MRGRRPSSGLRRGLGVDGVRACGGARLQMHVWGVDRRRGAGAAGARRGDNLQDVAAVQPGARGVLRVKELLVCSAAPFVLLRSGSAMRQLSDWVSPSCCSLLGSN
ncbi:hypothetical protein ZWY2020_017009 [Hordeum vulgare]|nr:hypothetical protein ZWY2020_017009 [Hordeum vulgare]